MIIPNTDHSLCSVVEGKGFLPIIAWHIVLDDCGRCRVTAITPLGDAKNCVSKSDLQPIYTSEERDCHE